MRSDQPAGICIPEAFITRLYRRKRNMEEFRFEQELLALHDKLFGYACKLFSEKEEAEDLLQETFLKALANKNKYNENSNFKGWMYTIMHNTYLNICQDKQHTQRNSLSDDKIFMEVNNEEGLLICNEYDLEEIHKIISKLPEGFSSILTMRLAGFKYHEIAQEFNIPVSLVKNRIFCAKKKLREMLKDFYDN